jgi:hypothetical protein
VNACSAIRHLSTVPPKFFEVLVKSMDETKIVACMEEFALAGHSTEKKLENILPIIVPEVMNPLQKMIDVTEKVKGTLVLALLNVYKKEFIKGNRTVNATFMKMLKDRKDELEPKPEVEAPTRTQEDMAVDAVIQNLGGLRITNNSL